jgi:glyoxylase-like metal-dependent hydrolase (beta-lactamase superfamily II)
MLARSIARLVLAASLCQAVQCFGAAFAEPVDLGSGVYVFLGAREAPTPTNRGHVANQAFIVSSAGVIIIDSGSSAAFADHMFRAIRARTNKPLAVVILTRPVDDAIFGAAALQRHGAATLAHEAAAKLIAERCHVCLKNLTDTLGDEAMVGTQLPRPDRLLNGTQHMTIAGRRLELIDYSGAAAPGSIAVWDQASGLLFAGGLASFGRVPDIRDGALGDWLSALRDLARRPARAIVPAHGPIGHSANLSEVAAYLRAVDMRTAQAYAARISLLDAPRKVAVPEYRNWALYESLHPRNVHYAYLARERDELAKP